MNRICIFLAGALGDFLLCLPAVQRLRARFPCHRIHLVGNPGWIPLANQVLLFDQVLSLDQIPVYAGFQEVLSQDHPLHRFLASYDQVLSWFGDHEGRWKRNLEQACQGRVLVRPFSDHRSFPGHATGFFLKDLESFGIPEGDLPSTAVWPPSLRWNPYRSTGNTGQSTTAGDNAFLSLHPGSGSKTKNWPKELFLRVARGVRDRWDVRVRVLLGEAEAEQHGFWKQEEGAGLSLERARSLPEVAEILSRSLCYLGNDSGISHLAASLGVPTVAIFGPTDPARYAPRGPRVKVLFREQDTPPPAVASSTTRHPCASLLAISPEEVLAAIRSFLR